MSKQNIARRSYLMPSRYDLASTKNSRQTYVQALEQKSIQKENDRLFNVISKTDSHMIKNLNLKTHTKRVETLQKNLASIPRLITNEQRAKRLVWNTNMDSQYMVRTNASCDTQKLKFLDS